MSDSGISLTLPSAKSLILEKVTERLTGIGKNIRGEALEWGIDHEDEAIIIYEQVTGTNVERCGFVELKGYEEYCGVTTKQ